MNANFWILSFQGDPPVPTPKVEGSENGCNMKGLQDLLYLRHQVPIEVGFGVQSTIVNTKPCASILFGHQNYRSSLRGGGWKQLRCCNAERGGGRKCWAGGVQGQGQQLLRSPRLSMPFVRPGDGAQKTVVGKHTCLLTPGRKWEMLADLGTQLVFPTEITQTTLKLDVVMWSTAAKKVFIIELTVPWEEGMSVAYEHKRLKYSDFAA
ncbi:hypothetical protein AOLI_G00034350 [Acnodon oligacanthus]